MLFNFHECVGKVRIYFICHIFYLNGLAFPSFISPVSQYILFSSEGKKGFLHKHFLFVFTRRELQIHWRAVLPFVDKVHN